MIKLNAVIREIKFASRDRSLWLWGVMILSLSSLAVGFGLAEVDRQHTTIQQLIEQDQQARSEVAKKVKDWGSAAYYSFHLTYDEPSDFAYAAMGTRDTQPWKHRVRMLALEGQIYESDVGNPSVALIGRFDFAFFAAFIIPLVLIMMLYDIRATEKAAGRFALLEATVGNADSFWRIRAAIRAGLVFICLVIPLIVAGMISGTTLTTQFLALSSVFIYVLFWTSVCVFLSAWNKPSSVILMALIGIWLTTAVIIPAASRLSIDKMVALPSGADILLLQREAVNDAWDLPRQQTMDAFIERHPQWADYKKQGESFEWQWYYAFQQVGDQQAEPLSDAFHQGKIKRSELAVWVSLLAPPSLLEKVLQSLADTDMNAALDYEQQVRDFHAQLRDFYYPKFFEHQAFDKALLEKLPEFTE
jgi:ABC-2 type transport system permease protein